MINLKWVFDIIASYKINASEETLKTLEALENSLKSFIKESNKLNGTKKE